MKSKSLLHRGSVKDLYQTEKDASYVFCFSDRYSIFDWGAMPDELRGKGKALSTMADFFFHFLHNPAHWKDWEPDLIPSLKKKLLQSKTIDSLREKGLSHHSLGLVDDSYKLLKPGEASRNLMVCAMNVIQPKYSEAVWDYSSYENKKENTLVPLEVIFRFGVPKGSSFLKRAQDNTYIQSLGLEAEECPQEGKYLSRPIIEFSTKLEPEDRIVSYEEARKIAAMDENEFTHLLDMSLLLALRLKDIFSALELELWDGKFEFAFTNMMNGHRGFQLIDSIGPDELRITSHAVQLSKECLRQVYMGSDWQLTVEKAKKMAKEEQHKNWKDLYNKRFSIRPEPLAEKYKLYMEEMYLSLANSLFEKFSYPVRFLQAIPLSEVTENLLTFKEAIR